MDQSRWQQLQDLLDSAWEVPDVERVAWLEAHCDDEEVRARAERLLTLDEEAEDYFGRLGSDVGFETGDAADETQVDLSGRRVGNYRLLEPLGRGGMGVVYVAERADGTFEHQVAVKLLGMGASTPEMRSRFVTERQILADLEHPAIARLLDGGVAEDGTPYFVMERVDGERIDRWCDARQLGVRQRMELLCRVCEAIEYAHRRLVIHRDLKPSNVLVTDDGDPKLLDFGVAKLLADPQSGLTVSQSAAPLTPTWAAPEQIEHGRVTTATDTYSLGALACLLLAGVPPRDFESRTAAAIARQLKDEPTAPSRRLASLSAEERAEVAAARGVNRQELAQRLNGDLDAIVLKALAYEPERRYGSAAELAADLKAHLAGRPVTARAPSLGYRTSRFVARHKVGVAAGAAILVLLLSLVGVSVKAAVDSRRQAEQVTAERDRAQQVTEFLKSLFKASDPDIAQGREVTARELLDQGARQVSADSSFADNPDLRAEMQVLLGDLYRQVGDLEAAKPLLAEGLESAGAGAELETRVEALHALGTLEMDTGEHDQALDRLERAERLLEDGGMVPGRKHATLMPQLLTTLSEVGRFNEAVDRGEVVLAAAREVPGLEAEALFHYLSALSTAHLRAEQDDLAESLLREALALEVELAGDPTIRMAVLSDLASVLGGKGRLEEAVGYMQQAVALADAVLDPLHPNRARLRSNLGHTLSQLGRFDEAEAALRQALEIYETIYADSAPPRVAAAHNNLGSMLRYAERYAAAEAHLARAREMAAESFGTDDPRYSIATANLGDLQRRLGRHQGAELLLTEAFEIRRRALGPEHPMVGTAQALLAELRLDQDRPGEALDLASGALALFERADYDRPDAVIKARKRQARALAELGRMDEAEAAFGEALAMQEQAGDDAGAAGPEILGAWAEFLLERDSPEAPSAIQRAVEEHRRLLGEDHPATRRMEALMTAPQPGQ